MSGLITRELTKWELRWVEEAEKIASWSKDQNTKIGAIIVDDKWRDDDAKGYNGIPRGVEDDIEKVPERYSREGGEKYYWFEHGERNAIYNACRKGISPVGKTMYLNCGVPCMDCARGIIQVGIKKIVCKEMPVPSYVLWEEHFKRSRIMFKEAGVEVVYY